jgi:hypothetical protein
VSIYYFNWTDSKNYLCKHRYFLPYCYNHKGVKENDIKPYSNYNTVIFTKGRDKSQTEQCKFNQLIELKSNENKETKS